MLPASPLSHIRVSPALSCLPHPRTPPTRAPPPHPHPHRSLAHLPEPVDSERPKQYVPRNAAAVHPAFPVVPAGALDPTPALFSRLEPDTLFFVFYYNQNTYAQYLAARELRRQGWRYSNRTCTFYKRAPGEPEEVTPEGDLKGSFLAFEYESGWTTRLKKDVTLTRAELAERDDNT